MPTAFLHQSFSVNYTYTVCFTQQLFAPNNPVFRDFLGEAQVEFTRKLLFVLDEGVIHFHPHLLAAIEAYVNTIEGFKLTTFLTIKGGEECKNNPRYFNEIIEAVNEQGIDRHSYLVAIGGGSLLDLAGYAAAVAHRGVKHIRIPTTVLSQNDSGVGVKNSINYRSKKNFLGTFAPPAVVFNDFDFLSTLSQRDWRSGIAEAIKVALIKDASFFEWLEKNSGLLNSRDSEAMQYLVQHCADLHMQHIRSGDPFESGSSRPLDFGHWSAHKLEQLTHFELRHGEAVALGIALDTVYSWKGGTLSEPEMKRIIMLLQDVGFAVTHPLMQIENADSALMQGLNEFREHLGGRLTIMLLTAIGTGQEVHHLDSETLAEASRWLQNATAKAQNV